MPSIDFSKPQTFFNTLESFALALNSAMVALRNEAKFHDQDDPAAVDAATLFASMLEDAHTEVMTLSALLERRALGKTDS
jgi:hypothetical protein